MSLYATNRSGGSGSGSGATTYPNLAAFPATASDGALAIALDTHILYEYNLGAAAWQPIASNVAYQDAISAPTSIGNLDSQPANAQGLTLTGNVLSTQSADATHPGMVNNAAQTLSGSKTFSSVIIAPSGIDVTATAGTDTLTIGAIGADVINIGNSGATINIQGTTLYENVTQLQVTDPLITINKGGGAGSGANSGFEIEEAGVITAYAETSSDRNSWALKAPNTAGIVTLTPGVAGITLDQSSHNPVTLGTANGLTLSTQQLSLGLSSTSTTGALSSTDWNTFNGKQPAGSYITALTGDASASGPGSAALTLATVNSNVGSFTNASVTVNAKGLVTAASSGTTGNLTDAGTDGIVITGGTGAVLGSGTSIAQHVADTTHNGYLSSTDWNTFNGKQPAGSYVTSVAVATANGLAGSSSGGTTPSLTLSTTVTGILQGNGTAISAASTNGTGAVVLTTSPALVTPNLGTPSAAILTSATGLPLTSGVTGTLPVGNGGTGVTASSGASSVVLRDANSNTAINNLLEGYATTATAAGTTTLTVSSAFQQFFTGSTTQTVVLPVTSTLVLGQSFLIVNLSSGIVTVQSSGANTVQAMAANTQLLVTCILTSGTTAASWNGTYQTSSLVVPVSPTVQKFTSSSGTYTTPSGVQYIRVRMVGGGGGGGGSGTSPGSGTAGGNTTFGTTLLVANGGGSGGFLGGSGGSGSLGTGPIGTAISGGSGTGGTNTPASTQSQGGTGGGSFFAGGGGGGAGTGTSGGVGFDAAANSGAGGGGGAIGSLGGNPTGGGGGAGGFVDALITSPSATYSYAVGAAGSAGAGGTSGAAGGAGAAGYIEVIEYYSNLSVGTSTPVSAGTYLGGPYSGSAANPTFKAFQAPTVQTFASGSGTYTTPAGVLYIIAELAGGGGGGAGGGTGTSGGSGSDGTSTTFGTLTAALGSHADSGSNNGGAGGAPTVGAGWTAISAASGGGGGGSTGATAGGAGITGGVNALGGNAKGPAQGVTSSAAASNSGAGGCGGSANPGNVGAGGGAGAWLKAIIAPTAGQTFAYSVGTGGNGGSAGTTGNAGGAGGSGIIRVTEYYQ